MIRTLLLRSFYILFLFSVASFGFKSSSAQSISQPFHPTPGFTENKGQIVDQNGNALPDLLYMYNNKGMKVQLYQNHFSYEMIGFQSSAPDAPESGVTSDADDDDEDEDDYNDAGTFSSHRVDVEFVGANQHPLVTAEEVVDGYNNYYQKYLCGKEVLRVHKFSKVTYHDLYPKIDMVFRTSDDSMIPSALHYDFI
ncbi:MAG: hypothetical protein ACHQD9_05365, partial [Chitinophagales bacterium]